MRSIATSSLAFAVLIAWASMAQAAPHLVFTHHSIKVDIHDLDLSQAAGQRALQNRIAEAADHVCGGRPDTAGHRDDEQLKLLAPAYEQCRADAIGHALSSISATTGVKLADSAAGP